MGKFKQVPTHTLCVGSILKAPITDPDNDRLKLLAEGVEITHRFIEKLHARGISFVEISVRDLAVLGALQPQGIGKKAAPAIEGIQSEHRNDYSDRLDQLANQPDSQSLAEVADPFSANVERPENCAYEDGVREQWAEDHDRSVFAMCDLSDGLVKGEVTDAAPLDVLCTEILGKIIEDADAVVCLGSTPYDSEYPTRHSIHVATIAMAIAVEMGLGRDQIVDLGVGCLIHDMGMQATGTKMFQTKSKLSRTGLGHLANHPVQAAELAGQLGDTISISSTLVAYQMHERGDGSGYPRGLQAPQIHSLSKIGAVADAYVAMLSPRPHRVGLQGHYVMVQLLDEMKARKFDPLAIRGLLQIASLYPVGSCVELTNGNVGRVIRTGLTDFEKPTIEMWRRDNLAGKPAIVNLRFEHSLAIECSIPSLEAAVRYARP